jgi:endonuclease YncB( thermonuclease family)
VYEYAIKEVIKVVDGDTIDILIDLGFDLTKKERVRLAGIDTPESRTRDLEEKAMGIEAKEFLTRRLTDGVASGLRVKTEKDGKYGRMLGWLFCGDTNINTEMVYRGYAWEYDGGKKEKSLDDLRIKRGVQHGRE